MWDKNLITTDITSQISKIAVEIATQIKAVITTDLSTEVIETFTLSPVDIEEDHKRNIQSPTKDNDMFNTTPMEVDTDPRKRKEPTAVEE